MLAVHFNDWNLLTLTNAKYKQFEIEPFDHLGECKMVFDV